MTQTTLAVAAEATDTRLYLTSTTGIVAGMALVLDRELVLVRGEADAGNGVPVARGVTGYQTAHAAGVTVTQGQPGDFHTVDPTGPVPANAATPWINVLTGESWVVSGSTWVSSTDANVTTNAADISTLEGTADGLGSLRVARATFDATAGKAIGAHGLGVTIPDNALVVGGFVEVGTTFTSEDDSGTIALHINAANDLITATAISSGTAWDAGKKAIVPKANTPESTSIKLTADREITATVAVQALTAGVLVVFLYYVQGL